MIVTKRKMSYMAFGVHILSEIPLPELSPMGLEDQGFDVEVVIEDLKMEWEHLAKDKTGYIFKESYVLFRLDDIAIFLIKEGKKISISPLKDYKEDIAKMIVLGTCIGAILLQRNILPLHGSTIAVNGKAYAIVGESGAGKSTLASTFIRDGYPILTDDIIAVSILNERTPFVIPSYPQQKLWQETLHEFGKTTSNLKSVYGRQTKYYVPLLAEFLTNPLPLAGIFELVKIDQEEVEVVTKTRLEQLSILYNHTYRNLMISGLRKLEWHFKVSTNILNNINVYQLQRPISRFTSDELVSIILEKIRLTEENNKK
ncbi:ATP-binding cassette domain-containing protein [Metabacillus halosaccharovorans]|uniref:ATP-binding cassette domain-containing protein n=1 Tax=Metabacillus halosaccharovorans TaxID=930124 RepID=UPI000995396B|nr:ATP-binding cassette domain-containing protein [Metabacillus halosaccharovorans]